LSVFPGYFFVNYRDDASVIIITAVLFGLKFADDIHYKCKSSQASKDRLQSSKDTGAKQSGHSMSFKVTCFGVSGKAIRDKVILNTNVRLICYCAMHLVLARYCYRMLSVRPSVRLSVPDVDVRWAYRLDQFEINYTNN